VQALQAGARGSATSSKQAGSRGSATSSKQAGAVLCLVKWANLFPSMEFRCFVKNKKLVGE
jgi:hypothetical protein